MASSGKLTHPDDDRHAGRDGADVPVAERDLVRALHLLDDLADVLDLAASVDDRSGGPNPAYAARLAQRVHEVRTGLRQPQADHPDTGGGAGEWRAALCVALDNVALRTASMRFEGTARRAGLGSATAAAPADPAAG